LLEGEGAANVGVEHKKAFRFALEDGISEVVETACCAKSLVFSEVSDFELRKLSRGVLDEVSKNTLVVVANQDDFFDVLDFGDGFEAMPDDWVAGYIEERL
jgi:hypothetical protein